MLENEEMPEDLSEYPLLITDLVIDETGDYGEPPTPVHRLRYFKNDQEFYGGHGVTMEAAVFDLVDSILKIEVESKPDDITKMSKEKEEELRKLGIFVD